MVNYKLAKVRAEIERRKKEVEDNISELGNSESERIGLFDNKEIYNDLLSFIDSMQEEPKECMYSKDNYTDEDRKALCDGCKEECKFNKKEEPASEDLEEAGKEWLKPQLDKSYANYGEAKMMELTHFDGYAMLDAVEFGANWQKQQMMAKAVKVNISNASIVSLPVNCDLKVGDKVLIIKEN